MPPDVLSLSGYRDVSPYLYSLAAGDDPLAGFSAALEDVDNTPVDIVIFGNSVVQGTGASTAANAWPYKLAEALTDTYGPNSSHGFGWLPCRLTGGGDTQWTLTNTSGNSAQNTSAGFGLWAVNLRVGDSVSITTTCDRIGVKYTAYSTTLGGAVSAGGISVDVDEETVHTEDTYDDSLADSTIVSHSGTFVSDDLGLDEHTITITATDTSHGGTVVTVIDGIFAYQGNNASGVRLWAGGHAQFSLGTFNGRPSTYDVLDALDPALVIQAHMINDRTSAASYDLRLAAFATEVNSRVPDADVVLASEYQSKGWTATDTGAGNYVRYRQMLNNIRDVAAANGYAYLDVGNYLGNLGFDGTETDPCDFQASGDTLHVNDDGHAAIADIYYAKLTGAELTQACVA